MLYQLSYASPAQTEQKYHRGNRIASNYLRPAKPLPVKHLFPLTYLFVTSVRRRFCECGILDRFVVPYFSELNRKRRARTFLMHRVRELDSVNLAEIAEIFREGGRAVHCVMQ